LQAVREDIINEDIVVPAGWKIATLEDVCHVRKRQDIRSDLYIGLEHIGQGNNLLISKGNSEDFKSTKNSFLKGDILYGKLRPLLNKVYLSREEGYCSTDIIPLCVKNNILAGLLLKILTERRFVSFAVSSSSGTKMPRTNWSDMKNFKLLLPPLSEQRNITSIFHAMDELIGKQIKSLSKLIN
jgi:type I restriction enzyme, S subunit